MLPRSFYKRDTAIVARSLLGKILVHKMNVGILKGRIVETEAYFGEDDPASRAFKGKGSLASTMLGKPGIALVYGVHANWLFNAVTENEGKAGGVLIRALEPIEGIERMKENRKVDNLVELTNGPGKLSEAMNIDKGFHGCDLTKKGAELFIQKSQEKENFEICSSHRIGVTKDLPEELRFYIKGNKFVSG